MMSALDIMMATERVRDDYARNIIRHASLRPGPFELSASEQYIIDRATRELEKAKQLYREELTMKNQDDEKQKIAVSEGTEGQNTAWPGEGRATKESGTDKTEDPKDGTTRKPERVNIPIVR